MKKIKNSIAAIFILATTLIAAQDPAHFVSTSGVLLGTSQFDGVVNVSVPSNKTGTSLLIEKTTTAKLFLKLDLGNDYVSNGETFTVDVTVNYYLNGNLESTIMEISEIAPEQLAIIDLMPNVSANDLLANISVNATAVVSDVTASSLTENYITSKLKLTASIERDFGVDVRLTSGDPVTPITLNTPSVPYRRANFSWNSIYAYPNYEIQILRLYNENASLTNPLYIGVTIDWTNALRVETQNYATSIDLIIAEGTGFYVWRVRPIGNYASGGIANQDNYGQWSTHPLDGIYKPVNVPMTTVINEYFHFTDPDEDKNWIYNRVFSEGDESHGTRVSEGISYADGLLRTRQSQAYNSDNDKTIVSQSVSDFSGRQALSTIPVPVNGGLDGYKASFVQNSNGDLYTAFDYDDTDIQNPDMVNDIGTDFDYYDGTQTDGVGSTEGYSFSRTVFKTDGTGRPTESSGIGKKHALGTRVDGKGRTTRVIYGSPSDAELIRIFGDEAPLAESVIKTITIDPNDVVSVSYTSKEGKTIATALISNRTDNLLDVDDDNPTHDFDVVNSTNQNVMAFDHFSSTKRIALWEEKEVTLEYNVNSFGAISTGDCPTADCAFEVKFYLYDLKNNVAYVSDLDGFTGVGTNSIEPFIVSGGSLTFPSTWEWVLIDNSGTTGAPVVTANSLPPYDYDVFTLPQGEYLFKKKVYSANTGTNFVENLVNESEGVLTPILDAIAAKMTAVNNNDDLVLFDDFLADLSAKLDLHTSGNDINNQITTLLEIDPSNIIPYDFGLANNIGGDPGDEMGTMTISTGCCGNMDIPVPKPERCLPCESVLSEGDAYDGIETIRDNAATSSDLDYNNGSPGADWTAINNIVKTEFISYLLNELEEEFETVISNPIAVQQALDSIAPGFTIESLAYMITNMLTSKYYTGKSLGGDIANPTYRFRADENTSGVLEYVDLTGALIGTTFNTATAVNVTYNLDLPFNYDKCDKLFNCWASTVDMLESFGFEGGTNVMDAYNEEEGDEESEEHYDDEESQDGSGGSNGLLDFIISWKMRKFNNSDDGVLPESKLNSMVLLPVNFLNCAGYEMVDILDDDITTSTIQDYSYTTPVASSIVPSSIVLTSLSTDNISGHGLNAPILINDYGDGDYPVSVVIEEIDCDESPGCTTSPHNTLIYPYVLKPEWMFKYFAYNSFDAFNVTTTNDLPDDNRLLVNQLDIEIAACYNDPNLNCPNPLLEPCFGKTCNYFHKSWSAGQRYNFYKQISGGRKCPKTNCDPADIVDLDVPVQLTKTELVALANSKIQNAYSICDNRAGEFMSAIVEELSGACYDIVECTSLTSPPWEVSEANVVQMVEAVVAACSARVDLVEVKLNLPLTGLYGNPYGAGDMNTQNIDDVDYLLNDGNDEADDGEYPWSTIISCNWINYATESCEEKSKQIFKLFPDCDQTILDQIMIWSFELNLPFMDKNSNSVFDKVDAFYTGGADTSPVNGIDDSFEVTVGGNDDLINSNGINDLYECFTNEDREWESFNPAVDCPSPQEGVAGSGSVYSNQTTVSATPQ